MASGGILKSLGLARGAILTAGKGVLGWAGKELYHSKNEKKKRQVELELLVRRIIQEPVNNYLNPHLCELREFFQSHWDALMAREENQSFWKDWLSGLNNLDKIPAVGISWNTGKREKLMMDLGKVRF